MYSKIVKWVKHHFGKKKPTGPRYWYILYEDGRIDGGLIRFDHAFQIACLREKNGRKNFQIVCREKNDRD